MSTEFRANYVFGDEEDVYQRLIYGTSSQAGIPTGTFYDTRALPVPYTPRRKSPILWVFNDEYLNVKHTFNITRESQDLHPASEKFYFTPTEHTSMLTIPVYLGRGLNTINVTVDDETIYTFVCTATVYALFLHTLALEITRNVTSKIDALMTSVFSTNSTRLAEVFLGSIADLFPQGTVVNRMVTQLVVSGLMNNAGSTAGILDISSVLGSTARFVTNDTKASLVDSWLYPLVSFAHKIDRTMQVWAGTKQDGRGFGCLQFLSNTGATPGGSDSLEPIAYITDGFEDARHTIHEDAQLEYDDPEEWAEVNPGFIPVIDPSTGSYAYAVSASITCDGAVIYYTTDGTKPTTSSTVYTSEIAVEHTTTIKAIAVLDGVTSSVATSTITVTYPDPTTTTVFLHWSPTTNEFTWES